MRALLLTIVFGTLGTADYVPADGTRVVLVGLHAGARQLAPVGVARIAAGWVESEGAVALERLDFLGYALVNPDQQSTLSNFAAGAIGLAALTAALEQR